MCRYDVPATVEYITSYTSAAEIGYLGFSQGTAQGFAALSTQPKTATRINCFAALSPAVTVRGTLETTGCKKKKRFRPQAVSVPAPCACVRLGYVHCVYLWLCVSEMCQCCVIANYRER